MLMDGTERSAAGDAMKGLKKSKGKTKMKGKRSHAAQRRLGKVKRPIFRSMPRFARSAVSTRRRQRKEKGAI